MLSRGDSCKGLCRHVSFPRGQLEGTALMRETESRVDLRDGGCFNRNEGRIGTVYFLANHQTPDAGDRMNG